MTPASECRHGNATTLVGWFVTPRRYCSDCAEEIGFGESNDAIPADEQLLALNIADMHQRIGLGMDDPRLDSLVDALAQWWVDDEKLAKAAP